MIGKRGSSAVTLVHAGGGLALSVAVLAFSNPAAAAQPRPHVTPMQVYASAQTIYSLKDYPDAVCNDGTPGAYMFRPGSGAGARNWVFHLRGGGQCIDNASCATRSADQLSSNGYVPGTPGPAMGGILSASSHVNPDFHDFNAVDVVYCSSDFWAGDTAPKIAGFDSGDAADTWYFRGRAIAIAALQDLYSKGLADADTILFSGSSAGGIGIILDANDLLPLAPATARKLVVDDAGYTLDIGAYDRNLPDTGYVSPITPTPGEVILTSGAALWGGRGDRVCDAAAMTQQEHVDCYNSASIINAGTIAQPVFVAEALQDSAQLIDDGLPPGIFLGNGSGNIYSHSFASAMSCLLQGGQAAGCSGLGVGAGNAIYAPYAHIHTMLDQDAAFSKAHFFDMSGKLSAQQQLGLWFANPDAPAKLVGTVPEPIRLRDFLALLDEASWTLRHH